MILEKLNNGGVDSSNTINELLKKVVPELEIRFENAISKLTKW